MIEKTKLSLWDFFVSLLSGCAILLSVLAHYLFKSLITWKTLLDLPVALIAVASVPIVILTGLLFEPLANYITKLLTTSPYKYVQSLGFKRWDRNIIALEKKARQYIPNDIEGSTFEYCKNWLCQNASDDSYMPFLAKFGFYRSMFLLLLLNAISIPFIYDFRLTKTIMILLSLVILALFCLHRSGDFHRHISSTIYSRFISSFNRDTMNKNVENKI